MELFPEPRRQNNTPRITLADSIRGVSLMAARAQQLDCRVLFFPEAGGLFLKSIYQHKQFKHPIAGARIVSSKVTASVKSPIGKQICGLLTISERKKHLSAAQLSAVKKNLALLPLSLIKKIRARVSYSEWRQLSLSELILRISDVGIMVPADRISKSARQSVTAHNYMAFQAFRQESILCNIEQMSKITHSVRPLLNDILKDTRFARLARRGTIYVMDEAVSRGRTLSVLDIVFKSFEPCAQWRIGVLYCPLNISGTGVCDFVLSTNRVPFFSNRPDLVGTIVLESSGAFVRHPINALYKSLGYHKTSVPLQPYVRKARSFVRRHLNTFLVDGLVGVNDLVRLLHCTFVCKDEMIIHRCLDLNLTQTTGLVAVTSLYINMPNPFDPMPQRQKYKDTMLAALTALSSHACTSTAEYIDLRKAFAVVRKNYQFQEVRLWNERHNTLITNIGRVLSD